MGGGRAPHQALPRHVTVTNKRSGRSARARITDRGQFIKGRCIYLSRAAASANRLTASPR
ncbi:RlpA-like double-psi beta-barrel domain-containing protein [Tardiphaga sp. 619_E2_N8_5]|uniref:RlpA-like double-psi beta-barrel domain-containing protein n=1 Tax=unclassified Tardiphaga TaxID=2631404 RepID=UPI003F293D90